jgi:tetratricopeptide (TPR) repeat protein
MKRLFLVVCLTALVLTPSAFAADEKTDDTALSDLRKSLTLLKEDKKDEARTGFEKCLTYKLAPKEESVVRSCLGSLCAESDPDKALQYLKRAHELDADNTGMLPALGSLYARQRDWTAARECLNTYLAKEPAGESVGPVKDLLAQIDKLEAEDGVVEKLNKGVELYNGHKYADAIPVLEELQKTDHSHFQKAQQLLGLCYAGEGEYQKAIDIFTKLLDEDPKQPVVISSLATCYEGIGDLKQARACLKQYLHVEHSGDMAKAAKDRMPMLKKVMKTAGDADGPDYFQAVSKPAVTRWSLERMPLRVYIEPSDAIKSYLKSFDSCVPRALDLWCKATDGRVSWARCDDKARADIVVTFTDDPSSVGKTESHSEAGVCRTATRGQVGAKIAAITHADVRLLTINRDGSGFSQDEMDATVTHEIGHSLGMKQHSSNPNDVMFFAATKSVKDGLTDRDATTIKYVYTANIYDDGRIEIPGRNKKE